MSHPSQSSQQENPAAAGVKKTFEKSCQGIGLILTIDVNVQHFMQEANTTASLAHPHIVRLLNFDIQHGAGLAS